MIFAVIGAVVGVAVIRSARRQRAAAKDMARRIIPTPRYPEPVRGYWVGQPDTEAWHAEQARLDTIDRGE